MIIDAIEENIGYLLFTYLHPLIITGASRQLATKLECWSPSCCAWLMVHH